MGQRYLKYIGEESKFEKYGIDLDDIEYKLDNRWYKMLCEACN